MRFHCYFRILALRRTRTQYHIVYAYGRLISRLRPMGGLGYGSHTVHCRYLISRLNYIVLWEDQAMGAVLDRNKCQCPIGNFHVWMVLSLRICFTYTIFLWKEISHVVHSMYYQFIYIWFYCTLVQYFLHVYVVYLQRWYIQIYVYKHGFRVISILHDACGFQRVFSYIQNLIVPIEPVFA